MKKLKINKNFSKKFISLTLAGVVTLSTLVGCSNNIKNRKVWFKGNNLKNVSIIFINNEMKDIATSNSYCNPIICTGEHEIYRSVVDGEMFTDDDCKVKSSADYFGTTLQKHAIENTQNITSYLTIEEIEKANKNALTEEDVSNIIVRIFEEENSIQKTKKAN